MIKKITSFIIIFSILLVVSCTLTSTVPSEGTAKDIVKSKFFSDGRYELIEFKKTDGETLDYMGSKHYIMYFEVTFKPLKDYLYTSGGGTFIKDKIYNSGGTIEFKKTEKGWTWLNIIVDLIGAKAYYYEDSSNEVTTNKKDYTKIYDRIFKDLTILSTCLEAFKLDWGNFPIQKTPSRLTLNNAGAEILGNNKGQINIKGKKTLGNDKGPIKYIESLPKDPLDPNGNSYYYQSNSDGSKYVIYSYNNETKEYIFRDSQYNANITTKIPTP